MEVLAIIPARGGSKGIPGKNIKLFAGHPLIAWSIFAAREAKLVNRIIVSTDSGTIMETAEQYDRVEMPFMRPLELAEDLTTDLPVFQHAIKWLAEHEDYHPDMVVHLRPTSPIRPAGIIDEAIQLMIDKGADSVRSITPARQNPYKMWLIDPMRPLIDLNYESYNMPRQSLPQAYMHIGIVDVVRTDVIMAGSMSGKNIYPIVFSQEYDIDLDTLDDWERAALRVRKK